MKPTVIDPKTTTRASAFDLWMNVPNPMVTFFQDDGCYAADSAQSQMGLAGRFLQGLQETIFDLDGYRGI